MRFIMRLLNIETVRATEADISSLLDFAQDYASEAENFKEFYYDEDWLRFHLENAIKSDNDFIIILRFKDYEQEIVGAYWGRVSPQLFSPDLMGFDCFVYVSQYYREFGLGAMLVTEAENEFIKRECKMVMAGCNSGINENENAVALYRNHGYDLLGHNFYKYL